MLYTMINTLYKSANMRINSRHAIKNKEKRMKSEQHQKAVMERWYPTIPMAPFNGTLYLGNVEIPCDVLEDGTRLLRRKEFLRAMGRGKLGGGTLRRSIEENLPLIATANNLTPYLTAEIATALAEICYRLPNGKKVFGFNSTALPEACKIYLEARKDGVLNKQQLLIASS